MREERKKVWVDDFQTKLLWRTFSYWLVYTLALWNLLFGWWLLHQEAGNPLEQYLEFSWEFYPALIAFLVVFPVLAYDALKFSHRLVGPLYRFRKTMQAIAAGEPVRLIKLREDDFLTEMRDDFNQMLEALQRKGIPAIKPADPEDKNQQRQPA
jgi:methyl-accepting chemotaxis protein